MCPEPSPEKLAELADFYQPRRKTVSAEPLAKTVAARAQSKSERIPPEDLGAPPAGELNWVRAPLLRFGKESSGRKRFRPVMALGRERPPFYLALPQTTQRHRGRDFFRLVRDDYEVNLGDEENWPKWLYGHHESVPLKEQRRYLGRIRDTTMTRINSWQKELLLSPKRRRRGG